MATTTTPTAKQHKGQRVTFSGAVRSEWIKFRGLVSNLVLAGFTFLLIAANAFLMPWAYVFRDRGSPQADYDPYAEMMIDKTPWVGILLAILAALVMTNEYRSGQIKTTLLSVPHRVWMLLAKSLVVALVAFLIGVVSTAIGLAVAPVILAGGGYGYDLSPEEAARLIAGSGLYLATLSMIGIAIGVLIRNVVASVLSVIVLLVIVPVIPQMFSEYGAQITRYFPIQAGSLLISPADAESFGPWTGYLILAAWAVVSMIIAAVVLLRRDA